MSVQAINNTYTGIWRNETAVVNLPVFCLEFQQCGIVAKVEGMKPGTVGPCQVVGSPPSVIGWKRTTALVHHDAPFNFVDACFFQSFNNFCHHVWIVWKI